MTSLFGRAFRKETACEPARLPATEMPPRPVQHAHRESRLGPDTTPKLAFGPGPVDPLYDPCGAPPLENGGRR